MQYALIDLLGVAMAVVAIDTAQIKDTAAHMTIRDLQRRLHIPVMLVSRLGEGWNGAQAVAQFDSLPYFIALTKMPVAEIEWNELREKPEAEVPF